MFHPAVQQWFSHTFGQATPPQRDAWPAITAGKDTLIAAPTGSGKTLAAFLACINGLVEEGQNDPLQDGTRIVYVSPLKALSNDIDKNLQQPLNGIRAALQQQGLVDVDIRTAVRTGDTSASRRTAMRKSPPHILVTTPESLYILLTSAGGRAMLASADTLIVDEIHAVAASKRGSHLALSMQRLDALCGQRLKRIGLSATQRPITTVANFLTGGRADHCVVVDSGHKRDRDLHIALPSSPLEAVMAGEVWAELYGQLLDLIRGHRTTLLFVNTRRHAERVAKALGEHLGEEHVAAHHGSLSKEHRLSAEQRLKAGSLQVMVATASLELGIDVGDVELVCQLGSPKSISAFLQRVGRSGHWVGGTPKGRLFPLSRDDLVECTALLRAIDQDQLDILQIPIAPLDVLAQQLVAEVAGAEEYSEADLLALVRGAWPYRDLSQERFNTVIRMLAEGFATQRGRRSAWLHRDAVNAQLRPRKGARLAAVTNAGAIPDQFDVDVVLEPDGLYVGSLNEDFAIESLPGDIFQLGNTSYRVLRMETGKMRVADAQGQPPNIPFWFGEAPGRSDELSEAVSDLRAEFAHHMQVGGLPAAGQWAATLPGLGESAAAQLTDYLGGAFLAFKALPHFGCIIFERFFDQAGDMHLVLHSPFGSRINKAWGLALRKRFCRNFNFELQAAALEDSIVLSLANTHSFVLEEISRYLHPNTVREVLVQAMLDSPIFENRWRWAASIALAVLRFRAGKRTPPQIQRMAAEDLIAVSFPDQIACAENIAGDRQVPDHPLVQQAIEDCLTEAMDIDGLKSVLQRLLAGEIQLIAKDLTSPSPLAAEILAARPYAFLDDAPAEERRTRAVQARNYKDPREAEDLSLLEPAAIARVQAEVAPNGVPEATDVDELHDAMVVHGALTEAEVAPNMGFAQALGTAGRAVAIDVGQNRESSEPAILWVAVERFSMAQAVWPVAAGQSNVPIPAEYQQAWIQDEAIKELIRGRLELRLMVTAQALAAELALEAQAVEAALIQLEAEGFVFQGNYLNDGQQRWCERRLLARVHRYTLHRLRAEIEPVDGAAFMRFLLRWQGVVREDEASQVGQAAAPVSREAVLTIFEQLQGLEVAASAWESDVLPARLPVYTPMVLDELCQAGRLLWRRLRPPAEARRNGPLRSTPIAILPRQQQSLWWQSQPAAELSPQAAKVRDCLQQQGALFFDELVSESGLLKTQLEQALAELVATGWVTADAFRGLRALLTPSNKRKPFAANASANRRRTGGRAGRGPSVDDAGRWSLLRHAPDEHEPEVEEIVWVLLHRYGVLCRRVLDNERAQLPSWRKMLYVLRRLEARGELRGGRFIAGFTGEQFALPEAVGPLRQQRQPKSTGQFTVISAADPLNLIGSVLPGDKIPAKAGNKILLKDGVPVGLLQANQPQLLDAGKRLQLTEADVRQQLLPNKAGLIPRRTGKANISAEETANAKERLRQLRHSL